MAPLNGPEENHEFKWGAKKMMGRKEYKVQCYESFTYKGVEYRLFDCAYFYFSGQCETSIGKLVRMYETSAGEKKVKVIWFFRPIEIHGFLGEYDAQWDELFIACGDDERVSNINDVEAIVGKCNVVCISKDPRNPRPRRNDLRKAHYVFSCTFDTRLKIISEVFADAIAGVGVDKLFNRISDEQPIKRLNSSAPSSSRPSTVKSLGQDMESTKLRKEDNRDGKLTSRISTVKKESFREDYGDHVHVKKNPPVNTGTMSRGPTIKTRAVGELHASGSSVRSRPSNKRKFILE